MRVLAAEEVGDRRGVFWLFLRVRLLPVFNIIASLEETCQSPIHSRKCTSEHSTTSSGRMEYWRRRGGKLEKKDGIR